MLQSDGFTMCLLVHTSRFSKIEFKGPKCPDSKIYCSVEAEMLHNNKHRRLKGNQQNWPAFFLLDFLLVRVGFYAILAPNEQLL